MSDITVQQPDIIGLSVTSPNVLQLTVTEPAPVVLTVGETTVAVVGAVTLSGDVTGDSSANTVFAIRGKTVQGSPAMGSFLRYSGTLWSNVLISTYVKTSYYSTLLADRSLSNSITTTQNVFATPQDTFALEANSVYTFEGSYVIAAGSTTHTTAIGFSEFGNGSCHFTCISAGINSYGGVQRAQDMTMFATSIGGPINSTSTQTHTVIKFTGRITVVDATNFTPTLNFSAGPTGTCATKAGSWIKVTKLWAGETVIADPEWT